MKIQGISKAKLRVYSLTSWVKNKYLQIQFSYKMVIRKKKKAYI